MRRDMDLIRGLLMQVEEVDRPVGIGELDFLGHGREEVAYHVELMQACGLIDARVRRVKGNMLADCTVLGLTWDGADFLDSMRDERVWARAKGAIRDTVGSTTLDVVRAVCGKVALSMVMAAVTGGA